MIVTWFFFLSLSSLVLFFRGNKKHHQVDYVDLEGKTFMAVPGHTLKPKYEFGTMTHFAYRVEGGADGEELVVATTRLETMLGDTVSQMKIFGGHADEIPF